jgi:HEAT repeat protein
MPIVGNFDFDFNFDFDALNEQLENMPNMVWAQADVSRDAERQARQAVDQARLSADLARLAAEQRQLTKTNFADAYNSALDAFQRRQYDRAVDGFDRVVAANAGRVDGALYWKAFSQFRLGQRDPALATIAQLRRDHGQSRYLTDARVLEADIRRQNGQTIDPAQIDNDEIKLLAIQGLQRTEQVVPLLQEVLTGANSLMVKKRALYVLALSDDPKAQQLLLQYAKGSGTPDLQLEAIRYLVVRRDNQTSGTTLREVYNSTTDAAIKREVINAFVTIGRTGPTVIVGKGELARGTVVMTGPTAAARPANPTAATAQKELLAIFQAESDPELRRQIVSTMAAMGAIDQIVPLIRNEKDRSVQQRAVSALGGRRTAESTQALIDLYGTLQDIETREVVISALAGQRNADALVALARKESNLRLKTTIVRHLSGMTKDSKVAADYMAEVLK